MCSYLECCSILLYSEILQDILSRLQLIKVRYDIIFTSSILGTIDSVHTSKMHYSVVYIQQPCHRNCIQMYIHLLLFASRSPTESECEEVYTITCEWEDKLSMKVSQAQQ